MRYRFLRFSEGELKAVTFSFDDVSICYNPTRYKIWFVADKKPYCIEPGQTLYI